MDAVDAIDAVGRGRMKCMNFIIRKAMPEDIPGIALVASEAWHQTYAATLPEKVRLDLLDLFYSQGWLERAVARTDSLFEIAVTHSGQIVGFAQWVYAPAPPTATTTMPLSAAPAPPAPATAPSAASPPPAPTCELTRLYVRPASQNQGIGSALLKHGFGCLPKEIDTVTLGVKSDNARATNFYEKHGFVFEKESWMPIGNIEFHLFWFNKRRGVNGWAE